MVDYEFTYFLAEFLASFIRFDKWLDSQSILFVEHTIKRSILHFTTTGFEQEALARTAVHSLIKSDQARTFLVGNFIHKNRKRERALPKIVTVWILLTIVVTSISVMHKQFHFEQVAIFNGAHLRS